MMMESELKAEQCRHPEDREDSAKWKSVSSDGLVTFVHIPTWRTFEGNAGWFGDTDVHYKQNGCVFPTSQLQTSAALLPGGKTFMLQATRLVEVCRPTVAHCGISRAASSLFHVEFSATLVSCLCGLLRVCFCLTLDAVYSVALWQSTCEGVLTLANCSARNNAICGPSVGCG